jgi:hypothetical protein
MVVDSSGNLGIGTNGPTNKLQIIAGNSTGFNLSYDTSGAFRTGLFMWTAGGSDGSIGGGVEQTTDNVYTARSTVASFIRFNNGDTRFFNNPSLTNGSTYTPSERMRITSAGDVGVGTTTPDIFGRGYTRMLTTSSASGSAAVQINSATGQSAWLDMGVNGSRIGAVAASTSVFEIGTGGAVPVGIFTSGNYRIYITSGGDVGIGNASPNHRLDVQAATGTMGVTSTTGTNISYAFASNTGGSFLLGKDSSTGALTGTAYSNFLYNGSAYPMLFFTNGGERMRIFSTGEVGIGRTNTSGALLDVFNGSSSSGVMRLRNDLGGAQTFARFDYGGSIIGSITGNNSATAYNTSSDYRLKENIAPIIGALAAVAKLKPVTYDWKAGGSSQGFIAHELAEVVPDCVTGEKDGEQMQGVDTSFLVATLTAAIQEQQALIENLTTRLNALEGK